MSIHSSQRNKIHPYKFALYLSLAGLIMMFAALSSAYIVRQSQGNWLEFRLPQLFYVSTVFILMSSGSLIMTKKYFKAHKKKKYQFLLIVTFILGIGFLITQYYSWIAMYESGIDLKGNPAGSFVYALSILHAFHVLGGIAVLIVALYHAFTLKFEVTAKRILRLELTSTYWHFVDILWVYLLLFFILQR